MSEATDVLQAIDQLRRDLSGYHGQLKAHNDLQAHCDHQRERIVQLEGLYAEAKAENAKLRELFSSYWKRVHCPAAPTIERDYLAEMRELGIEV